MPEDIQEDVWEKCSERLASYTVTYWKPFQAFDKTTLSEGDQRIRRFFAISGTGSQYEKKDNRITLKIDSFDGQAFFILRTHNKSVSGVKGGSFREIEKHAYLITADQKDVTITLENDISLFYTDKG